MNNKYKIYYLGVLLGNMVLLMSMFLVSQIMFAKENIDMQSISVISIALGLEYYLYRIFGIQVAQMAARFILDIFPEQMEHKTKATDKLRSDLDRLGVNDTLFVYVKRNLYIILCVYCSNIVGGILGNYSGFFTYFLLVDIFILIIIEFCIYYQSLTTFEMYQKK